MQFLPATWAGFRNAYRPIAAERPSSYPHECAPHGCITDDYDSIAAAADYLHQLGADAGLDQRTLNALISYKGTPPASVPYARETFTLAQQLEAANVTSAGTVVQAPSGPLLARLVTVADEIAAARIPYCYGGGHVTPARPTHGTYCHNAANEFISGTAYDGLDCSGAVSMLLQVSGVNTPTLDSTGFMSFGDAGPRAAVHDLGEPGPRVREHRRTRLGHERRKPLRRARVGAANDRRLHPTTPAGPMSRRTLPMLLAAAIALAGCGLRDPYSQQPQKRPAAGAQNALAPVPGEALKPTSSAASVLARYAEAWVNWSAATLPHERAALLALATGQLAEQLRQDRPRRP